jgi:alkylmercury lyase
MTSINGTRAGNAINEFADKFGITLMNKAQASLAPALRELHRAILSALADTGAAPTVAWVSDRASLLGIDPNEALASLAAADLVHTAGGSVTVAYPFSGIPTTHRVEFDDDGPAAWAMCGGDALGMPLMTGRNATITSDDPHSGDPIRIRYDGWWTWEPATTVMLEAATAGCRTAAEAACRHIHFFTRLEHAMAYLAANPTLSGEVYDQTGAVEAGQVIFGPLLGR